MEKENKLTSKRSYKKGRKKRRTKASTGIKHEPKAVGSTAESSRSTDLSTVVMGLANVGRRHSLGNDYGAPGILFRECQPYYAFTNGWSDVADDFAQDDDAAWNRADKTQAMYPITFYANTWLTEVYPVYKNVLSLGLGYKPPITQYTMARYFTYVSMTYSLLLSVYNMHNVYTKFDWSTVPPYSSDIPNFLQNIAENFDLDTASFSSRWEPYMRRLNQHTLPPAMVFNIKRLLKPTLMPSLGSRPALGVHPSISPFSSAAGDATEDFIKTLLDALDLSFTNEIAAFTSFMPYILGNFNPWEYIAPMADPDYETAWYNSPLTTWAGFGDGTLVDEPTINKSMVFAGGAPAAVRYSTAYPSPVWGELGVTSVLVNSMTSSGHFFYLTPHAWGEISIYDDEMTTLKLDGAIVSTEQQRYEDFAFCRFTRNDLGFGKRHPTRTEASIDINGVRNGVRLQVQQDYNILRVGEVGRLSQAGWIRTAKPGVKEAF